MIFSTCAHFSFFSSYIFFCKSANETNIHNHGHPNVSQTLAPSIGTSPPDLGGLMGNYGRKDGKIHIQLHASRWKSIDRRQPSRICGMRRISSKIFQIILKQFMKTAERVDSGLLSFGYKNPRSTQITPSEMGYAFSSSFIF
jgi:hypothetical protein